MDVGETTKRTLVEATIHEIEAHGLNNVTVRGIATTAKVNVASVNYHFGSKARLVDIALGNAIDHVLADAGEILAKDAAATEVLAELLTYLLEGTLRYPRITQAHLARVSGDASLFPHQLKALIEQLAAWFESLGHPQSAQRATICVSATLFTASFGALFAGLGSVETAEQRAAFVSRVTAHALTHD